MNGYSRIKKQAANRSKSVDFADLSLTRSSSTSTTPNLSKFKSQGATPDLCTAVKITALQNSIPEHEHEHEQDDGVGEVFGVILGRKCCLSEQEMEITTAVQSSAAVKRSFSVRRSASLSDGYSRIHHRHSAEDGDQNETEFFTSQSRCVKKKGKFFRVFRRLFGL
ncbi:hypothetical protein C2S51_019617 [Perilla frutescens var. frutescens]|nr:hypothetical protein C2S51_019617 [Perilla frutescens var. frutescens]